MRADEVGEGKEGVFTISLNLETCQRLLRDRHKESGVDTGAIGSGGHIVNWILGRKQNKSISRDWAAQNQELQCFLSFCKNIGVFKAKKCQYSVIMALQFQYLNLYYLLG